MSAGELTDTKVAGYVAKAAECTGTLDRRVTTADRLDELPVRDHAPAVKPKTLADTATTSITTSCPASGGCGCKHCARP